MIEQTKEFVEKHYTVANGYEADSRFIYGDTDSVMIRFGIEDMAQSVELGTFQLQKSYSNVHE